MSIKLLVNTIPLLGEQSGVGKYTRAIVERLAGDTGFATTYHHGVFSKTLPAPSREFACTTTSALSGLKNLIKRCPPLARACKKLLRASARAHTESYDLYFEPNFVLLPEMKARHTVATVHDFSCILYPQWHPVERVRYFEQHLWTSLEQSSHIITVSEAIKAEAVTRFGLEAARITAIPNGVDHQLYKPQQAASIHDIRRRLSLPEQFVLFVGTMEPRKNITSLLTAYADLPAAVRAAFPLLLAGGSGWNNTDMHRRMCGSGVRHLGFVAEADLPALYGAASVFVYPSWYEGFGLPVLEALACGCPVIASTDAALREICGNTALFVPPDDDGLLRDTLHDLLEDPIRREAMRKTGFEQAARFSWDNSAQQHIQLFQELCA